MSAWMWVGVGYAAAGPLALGLLWAAGHYHPRRCECPDCHDKFVARMRKVARRQAAELDRKEARR